MKKLLFLTLMALLVPVLAFGLTPYATCDPQPNVVQYKLFIDGVHVATSEAVVDVETGLYYLWFDMKTLELAEGNYTLTATAESAWGESGLSNPYPFDVAIPTAPPNLRVSSE